MFLLLWLIVGFLHSLVVIFYERNRIGYLTIYDFIAGICALLLGPILVVSIILDYSFDKLENKRFFIKKDNS